MPECDPYTQYGSRTERLNWISGSAVNRAAVIRGTAIAYERLSVNRDGQVVLKPKTDPAIPRF